MVDVKKRRITSKDYDSLADTITNELTNRKGLTARKDHETLWKEVDRQVAMKPMVKIDKDSDKTWESALELGDLSTAHEVLTADATRLIFPQDRSWLQSHSNIEASRLQSREVAETKEPLSKKELAKLQKSADGELRAFMTQQHKDFGFKTRVGLSIGEALKHGSFVAEVRWEDMQTYQKGGVFKSASAPVWHPYSMWDCYPEEMELNANLIYTGSMIIEYEKSYEWILQQDFINLKKFQNETTDKKVPVKLCSYFGNITIKRKGDDVFLPNMKIIVANKTVLYAKPMDCTAIIFGGYDRADMRYPYYLSPLVKQSPNHKLVTILANKFLDAVDLKLEPPGTYDGNDQTLVAQGGPKIIPGHMTPSKGGKAKVDFMDVGDPSWGINALQYLRADLREGTGVSPSRAGAERQADRVTATQIEQESAGAEIRTIHFVGIVEKGILAYLYLSHELNKKNLTIYVFYNPEMGMRDFETIEKKDLPDEVHFEVVGSKGVLTERRRAQGVIQTTNFLLSHPKTESLVNVEATAKQMYEDNGVKDPERLMNIEEDGNDSQQQIEAIQAQAQEVIGKMQEEVQKVGRDLVSKEMELKQVSDQAKIASDKAAATETHLREEIQRIKSSEQMKAELMTELLKIKDEKNNVENIKSDIETKEPKEAAEKPEEAETIVVGTQGWKIERDDEGMSKLIPINAEGEVMHEIDTLIIERDENGEMSSLAPEGAIDKSPASDKKSPESDKE